MSSPQTFHCATHQSAEGGVSVAALCVGLTNNRGFMLFNFKSALCNLHFAVFTTFTAACLFFVCSACAPADEAANTPAKTPQAWTCDEAMAQLRLNPEDVYLQYVALQLARSENKGDEVFKEIENINSRRWGWRPRGHRAELFDIFSGAAAVQESLQLDTMRGQRDSKLVEMANPAQNVIKITDLAGPGVKSHPWDKMLAAQQIAGKSPEIGTLPLCVPADQYFIAFPSLTKLLDITDSGDIWGAHLFAQAAQTAKDQRTSERLKNQLAMQTDPLTRPFYDMVVDEVAITGSDLYLREGSDVTMLFLLKQPEVFRLRMDGFLDAAQKSRPDAVRSTGKIGEVEYVAVATPDRAIHVFSAYPKPNLHVRSNSKAAFERVLKTIAGEKNITPLGETSEFKYIRTLMVRGDKREDGFIYLSDPFIRRLVGPEVKLTEMRRLLCYNHLRMIGHAAMLYRTQYGQAPTSLEQLIEAGCAPGALVSPPRAKEKIKDGKNADAETFSCPCNGKYSLAPDGTTGVCSYHGYAHELIPCREIPLERVTEAESKQYKEFVKEYSEFWQRYFDPIAMRIQVTPEQYRAETIVLPLIDNSIYSGMATVFGGQPEPLDALPAPEKNILSIAARLNKEELLKSYKATLGNLGVAGASMYPNTAAIEELVAKGLGNQISMHVYDAYPMFDLNLTRFFGEMLNELRWSNQRMRVEVFGISFLVTSLNSPVYIAIPVEDAQIVNKFLEELDVRLAKLARQPARRWEFEPEFDFYRAPLEEKDYNTRCYCIGFGPLKLRMFLAQIDNVLYLTSKKFILDDLVKVGETAKRAESPKTDSGPTAHAMVRVRPEHWKDVLPAFQVGWAESSRKACLNNLGPLSAAARSTAATSGGTAKTEEVLHLADALYGAHCYCPDGGIYEVSANGEQVSCSIHDTAEQPKQFLAPTEGSPLGRLMKDFKGLTAELIFLEDGLHAVVTIKRK